MSQLMSQLQTESAALTRTWVDGTQECKVSVHVWECGGGGDVAAAD